MKKGKFTAATVVKALMNVGIIAIGAYIFFGFVDLSITRTWLPFLIVLTGVFSLPMDKHRSMLPSVILIALGLFVIAREAGLITVPVLRYGLGGALIVLGGAGLIQLIMQYADPLEKQPATG